MAGAGAEEDGDVGEAEPGNERKPRGVGARGGLYRTNKALLRK